MANIRICIFMAALGFLFFAGNFLQAQTKMDLDDIQIKGELHDDNQIRIRSREKDELKNHIQYRTNYRPEISEEDPLRGIDDEITDLHGPRN